MLNVDGSDFPKKGKNSVGVMRQHCGIMGKIDNCQAGVCLGYSSIKGYGFLDRRLYLPQKWFSTDYDNLRKQTAVPNDLTFQTKNELALNVINEAVPKLQLPFKWIGCDSAFGVDRSFVEALPEDCYYFADTRSNHLVFESMPELELPPSSGKSGRPFKHQKPSFPTVKASEYAEDENLPWQRISLAEGVKGADYHRCQDCALCFPP